jgi:Rps23 Pro-64 3,4-dihydroxylase Tpa1-like proline 4-hydroxylase
VNVNGATSSVESRVAGLTRLIADHLESEKARLRENFKESIGEVGVRYCVLDNLLPTKIAEEIHRSFPLPAEMRLVDTFREKKRTCKNLEKFDPLLADITFAVQGPAVIDAVEQITGIQQQIPASSLYAGGLSSMDRGHFLGPHIDNSHESSGKYYRTLNLLYYVTPNWCLEFGGNLELWDRGVRKSATVVSKFNRLVIMETNPWSWHSVSKVQVDRLRCCVSNYYFSPVSPIGSDYRNVTSFSARPEQKIRRALAWVDNGVRELIRVVVPRGVGKKDVYQSPNS